MEHLFNSHGNLDNKRLLNLGIFLFLILALIILVSLYASRSVRIIKPTEAVVEINPFETVEIEAKAAFVYDIRSGEVLFEKNADAVLPLASLTKIMTAVTALDLLPDYTVVTIDKMFLSEEGDAGLMRDEQWALRDLLDFSLVNSSNDAAAAIAAVAGSSTLSDQSLELGRNAFVEKMNAKAREIGMPTARFHNDTGLDITPEQSGGYASARDYAALLSYTLKEKPQIFEATKYEKIDVVSLSAVSHNAKNTNIALHAIPNVIGSKTGFTDVAGGNVAILFDPGPGRPIAIVVLGSSFDRRFKDLETLATKTLEAIGQGR